MTSLGTGDSLSDCHQRVHVGDGIVMMAGDWVREKGGDGEGEVCVWGGRGGGPRSDTGIRVCVCV